LTGLKGFARRKTGKAPRHLHAALGHNIAPTVFIANKTLCLSPASLPTKSTGISQPPRPWQSPTQFTAPQWATWFSANQPPLIFQSALLYPPQRGSTSLR